MRNAEKVGRGSTWRQADILGPPVLDFVRARLACRDDLAAPSLPTLTQHFGRNNRLVFDGFCKVVVPLLTESDPQTESDVTPTKQTPKEFLTETRTHISAFRVSAKFVSAKFATQSRVPRPHASLLTETGAHSEHAPTRSKQTTAQFLTETGIAHRIRPAPPAISSRTHCALGLLRGVLLHQIVELGTAAQAIDVRIGRHYIGRIMFLQRFE